MPKSLQAAAWAYSFFKIMTGCQACVLYIYIYIYIYILYSRFLKKQLAFTNTVMWCSFLSSLCFILLCFIFVSIISKLFMVIEAVGFVLLSGRDVGLKDDLVKRSSRSVANGTKSNIVCKGYLLLFFLLFSIIDTKFNTKIWNHKIVHGFQTKCRFWFSHSILIVSHG